MQSYRDTTEPGGVVGGGVGEGLEGTGIFIETDAVNSHQTPVQRASLVSLVGSPSHPG